MADIIGLAASAAGGGVFGVLGSLIGRVAGLVETRQVNAQERARWNHERELEGLRASGALTLAQEEGRNAGLAASLAAEAAIGPTYQWVNAVRALTRPVLTLLLWLITGVIFLGADTLAKGQIIETTTFAATAATLWWFGDRGQPAQKR